MIKRNIVHIEIPSIDAKKSGEFYKNMFGWHITRDEQMGYTMWEPHEGPGGGFSNVGQEAQVGEVLLYVNSEDIDSDLKQAAALGATIVQEKDEIPGTGWFGMFKDPTGNVIALYSSTNPDNR
ncbi:MAG: VOC family protein [Chloroflexi bacterium]|nr:VOC family protein [Chloroflexota bacterium]